MTEAIDVEAAARSFLAHTEEHLVSYLEAGVHCGQCAEACHFYEASQDPKHTPAYKLFPMPKPIAARSFHWPGLGSRRASPRTIFRNGKRCFSTPARCVGAARPSVLWESILLRLSVARDRPSCRPDCLLAAADNSRDHGSPLGLSAEKLRERIEWLADEHEVEIALDKDKADILLTVSSIEMMKYPDSVVGMAKLLNHNWTLSTKGYEAMNFSYLAGKGEIAKLMVRRITNAAESIGAKTVIIPECGHAFGVLRWQAGNMLGRPLPYAVMHITEFLAQLKREGKLRLKPFAQSITYHDPCQISQRGGATEDVRFLLKDFAEDFREMTPTGNFNWCCGGGGGVQAIARAAELRHKVFKIKMDQVERTGAKTMVSSCSNCRLTMDESKEYWKWQGGLGSLVELLADHLVGPKPRAE